MLITHNSHTRVHVVIVKGKFMEDLWWEFWERESESMLLTVLFLIAYLSPQSLVIVTMYHVSLFTVGDQAVTRALCVTASGRGRPDNNRLFHYLLQPFPGLWALTTGQSRDTDIGGHYLGPALISGCMCWPHYSDRDQASGSAHSLSHYVVPRVTRASRPHTCLGDWCHSGVGAF